MLDPEQRIWGFETNFGGLADIALVKANQLMPKPAHLTWEEAASPGLVNCTAYRQLVSKNGGDMKQGDNVLIWGASGGLGGFATQYALNGGATPVCVVSNEEKAAICRSMGAELIINRSEEDYRFWKDEHTQDPKEWKRFGAKIRELTGGEDIDIVFEHPGRETFGASVYVTRKGGTITTCASTSGYMHEYDNRYLWMNLKRIISSHFANYRESWEANRLIAKGKIHPTLSKTYPLDEVGQAALDVHQNAHQGKVGVLCLAPEEGLGVRDQEMREPARDRRSTGSAASDRARARTATRVCRSPADRPVWAGRRVPPSRKEPARMSQGLSIFDDEPDGRGPPRTPAEAERTTSQDQAAQEQPEAEARPGRRGDRRRSRCCPARTPGGADPAGPDRSPTPRPGRRRGRPHRPQDPSPPDRPSIPPRRGRGRRRRPAAPGRAPSGYDKRGRRPAAAAARRGAGRPRRAIAELETARAELEAALEALHTELAEAKNPSYAGLGGRASAMLRLAEEEAAEMREVAQSDAEEIREQATRDAQAIRADAAREAEDMRVVQPRSSTTTAPG